MYNNFFNPMQRNNNLNNNPRNQNNRQNNNQSKRPNNNQNNYESYQQNNHENFQQSNHENYQHNNYENNQQNNYENFQQSNYENSNYNGIHNNTKNQPDNFNSNTQQFYSNDNNANINSSSSGPDFMHNQKLSGIDPVKLKIIMEIREKSKNKSVEELLPEIMKINQELNKRHMNFSKNETEMLMEVIEDSLSPADRQRFNMLKGFLNQ